MAASAILTACLIAMAGATTTTPTFKNQGMMGTNVEWVNSTVGNSIYTNAINNGARMCPLGAPGTNAPRDATTGYPTTSFYVCLTAALSNGTVLVDGAMHAGNYAWTYTYLTAGGATTISAQTTGSNTPLCIGVSNFTVGTPVVNGAYTTVPFTFTLAAQATLTLSFSGPVTDLDFPMDGLATVHGAPEHRDIALAYYSQFGVLRTLDVLNGGGRMDVLWSDAPPDYSGPQLAQDVPSWQRVIRFILAVKAYPGSRLHMWKINLPPFGDPSSYATPLATLFNSMGVPAGFCSFEWGNEPFNFSGPNSTRFHGWENAAANVTHAIANYELINASGAPTALFKYPAGQVISGMSLDTAGNVTVTLTVACSTLVDYSTGLPYIVNGATAIISATTASFNALGVAANTANVVTISGVSGSTFTYNTGIGTTTASTAPGSTQIYFNPTHSLLADNISFALGNLEKKWYMSQLYDFRTRWLTVRPQATYKDEWYLNMSPIGGALPPNNSKTTPFEFLYGRYLGGGTMGSWLNAACTATYSAPGGTVASLDDLFNSSLTDSLYYALNSPALAQSVDNQCRGLVYQCLIDGIKPETYEGGVALQTTSSANFVVAANADPRLETYLTAHMRTVLNNGVFIYMNFNGSPRTFQNGSTGNSSWQDLQSFEDSIVSTDSNYAPKRAAQQKFVDAVSYSNINGADLTTLTLANYSNAGTTANASAATFLNTGGAATGMLFWGTGTNTLTRYINWVYPVNNRATRQIFVRGSDSVSCPVKVYMYGPDLSGPQLVGTCHLPANGNVSTSSTSLDADCADPITWTPPSAGPYVLWAQIDAGQGVAPGVKNVRIA